MEARFLYRSEEALRPLLRRDLGDNHVLIPVIAVLGASIFILILIILWMLRLLHKSSRARSEDPELGKQSSRTESPHIVPTVTSDMAEPIRTNQANSSSPLHSRFTDGDGFEEVELRGSSDDVRTAHAVSVMQVQKAKSPADVSRGASDIIGGERTRSPDFFTLRTIELSPRSRDTMPVPLTTH
ncbi:hypothetical protein HD806DRAFT_552717 [Xylariaceae sp. AK1471]|nr:hypothetical protein HD806DRAFT_552717 [Xylariaceae sp. AK1471]